MSEHMRAHLGDCRRIAALVGASIHDAYRLWCEHSSMYAAGWLFLPETDEELRGIIAAIQEREAAQMEAAG